MDYLSVQELSDRWKISKRRIQILCKEGRIEGAKMIGNMWVVPSDAKRPADARVKSPVVTTIENVSVVRKELKKLLNKLFKMAENCGIEEKDRRDIVLASVAYSLCNLYLKENIEKEKIFRTIYKDISGNNKEINPDDKMIKILYEFIDKYREDSEIHNILSWAYQYSNKIIKEKIHSQTQFFTEKYMVDYLVKNVGEIKKAKKIVDPCVGGGNFLVECLECMCNGKSEGNFQKEVISNSKKMYGYDIDHDIARIAVVNIRLRGMAILNSKRVSFTFDIWNRICPNIFVSKQEDSICGSLAVDNRWAISLVDGTEVGINEVLGETDIILTNPPFSTIKGMPQEEKDFLKAYYPDANCDTCVSFLDAIYSMLKKGGMCGIVSQNAWMHLKTFKKIRNKFTLQYTIHKIANLGSGAFFDLSGEKSNVSLMVVEKKNESGNTIEVLNLTDLSFKEKIEKIKTEECSLEIKQNVIDGPNGYDFTEKGTLNAIGSSDELYKDIAVPMQGTSTGNAKELVGYFWEHFGEDDWVNVSNGGGYCRWQGLNDSVVKWGKDGEYIKAQKGSALRNVKYFPETQMVFSDTGTAGLNVRVLLDDQIFIASGPGIRVKKGNEYAHLALLNSRLAAYFMRIISPKLTIAAGYIGQIPVKERIYSSVVLEKEAKLCVELKKKILSIRPNNLEFDPVFLENIPNDLDHAAWKLFNEDITNELLKLEIESKIDRYIVKEYGFSDEEEIQLNQSVGMCAYLIDDIWEIDLEKLDKYIAKLIDASCCLKRTRSSKKSLGSDGILEFAAKDLKINPEIIVRKIQDNPFIMRNVLNRYKEMILHDMILYRLGYDTKSGIKMAMCSSEILAGYLREKFGSSSEYDGWIRKSFNRIHKEIFKGVPYLICENEVIHKYDYKITG